MTTFPTCFFLDFSTAIPRDGNVLKATKKVYSHLPGGSALSLAIFFPFFSPDAPPLIFLSLTALLEPFGLLSPISFPPTRAPSTYVGSPPYLGTDLRAMMRELPRHT